MGAKFFIAIGVFPEELLAYQVSMVCIANWPLTWVECMISSLVSFAYFTHFSNLNISETNADICKR